MTRSWCIACLVILAGSLTARAGALEERGLDLSRSDCGRCHVVEEADRFSGISSTASFMMMVDYLPDWEKRFETFFERPPHPAHVRVEGVKPPTDGPATMAPVELDADDIDAILAYVRSLAGRKK